MWDGIEIHGDGAPLLDGALGWIECRLAAELATGDHTFFVGEVRSAESGTNAAPLIHIGQEYRSL
jgi:flavin reductase (DIM6/NTAB) family NADH-FMN oxidoreductase RutF